MSKVQRWLVAALMGFVFLCGTAVCTPTALGFMTMAVAGGCSAMPNWVEPLIYSPSVILGLGAIAGGIFFGLEKRWYWWVGGFAGGIVLAILAAVGFFAIVDSFCF